MKSAQYRPDDLVAGLVPAIVNPALAIDGFYLFSFNQVQETVAWRNTILQQLPQRWKMG